MRIGTVKIILVEIHPTKTLREDQMEKNGLITRIKDMIIIAETANKMVNLQTTMIIKALIIVISNTVGMVLMVKGMSKIRILKRMNTVRLVLMVKCITQKTILMNKNKTKVKPFMEIFKVANKRKR